MLRHLIENRGSTDGTLAMRSCKRDREIAALGHVPKFELAAWQYDTQIGGVLHSVLSQTPVGMITVDHSGVPTGEGPVQPIISLDKVVEIVFVIYTKAWGILYTQGPLTKYASACYNIG